MTLQLSDEDDLSINNFQLLNRYIRKRNYLTKRFKILFMINLKLILCKIEKTAILLTPYHRI